MTAMMVDSSAPGINRPKQRRSQETLVRLLRATRELLEETVFEDLTIQQIATRAGCSVGTFYGRFRNKDAILPCLLETHYAEMEREMDAAFSGESWDVAPLNRRVDVVVDHLMSIAQRQPGLIRTLVLRNNQRPDSIPSSIRAAAPRMLARIYGFLLEGRSEMNHPAERTAVEIGLLMVVSAIRERLILAGATHAATLSVSDEVFADELKHALLAYLTTPRA
jgi:AcrR family transcriptional regulator